MFHRRFNYLFCYLCLEFQRFLELGTTLARRDFDLKISRSARSWHLRDLKVSDFSLFCTYFCFIFAASPHVEAPVPEAHAAAPAPPVTHAVDADAKALVPSARKHL